MLYQSFSGDAQGSKRTFTQTGGSLTALTGPLFFVTNASGTVNLSGAKLSAASGILLKAGAASWGTTGSNGGTATLTPADKPVPDPSSSTRSARPCPSASASSRWRFQRRNPS